jgi:hypothetical protein
MLTPIVTEISRLSPHHAQVALIPAALRLPGARTSGAAGAASR